MLITVESWRYSANLSKDEFTINDGDRIAQLVIAKHETAEWIPVESLEETERGAGGFGSSSVAKKTSFLVFSIF